MRDDRNRERPVARPPGRRGADVPLRVALAIGVAATAVALGLMFWARTAYQIRTLPERIMEWLLLFIPLDLFEKGLQTLGANAKDVALDGVVVGMIVVLIVVGIDTARGTLVTALLTGAGLWLFAMAVVMPVTGAGFFATGLFQDVLLTNLSYLGIALAYTTMILLGKSLWLGSTAARSSRDRAASNPRAESMSRRAFVGAIFGTLVAYAVTILLGQSAGSTASDLPLASVATPAGAAPTTGPASAATSSPVATTASAPAAVGTAAAASTPAGAITPEAASTAAAASTPGAVASPSPVPSPTAGAPAATAATPVPQPTPTIVIPPAPSPERELSRNKDGVLAGAVPPPGEVAPLQMPNQTFYITTKNAAGDPVVDPAKWRLAIDGEVVKPVQLDLRILYQLPTFQVTKTLECISNFVVNCEQVPFGCNLISNATWQGTRLSDLLALAGGLKSGVQSIGIFSADEYAASLPPDPQLLSETYLVYAMNGKVLPLEHGYPARLLTPGRYGMKSPKWVIGIRPMNRDFVDWFGQRGWSHTAVVQTMTRIDVPGNGQTLPPGEHRIAGIAYAGNRGISRVEYSIDNAKTWRTASFLEKPTGVDQWARWESSFVVPASGTLRLAARAFDSTGAIQTSDYNPTQPNGATGLRVIEIKAGQA